MCVPILYYEQTNTFGLQLVQKNTHIKKRSFIQIAKTKIKKIKYRRSYNKGQSNWAGIHISAGQPSKKRKYK